MWNHVAIRANQTVHNREKDPTTQAEMQKQQEDALVEEHIEHILLTGSILHISLYAFAVKILGLFQNEKFRSTQQKIEKESWDL